MSDEMALGIGGRTCGTCTLCRKLFELPHLQKPAGRWCQHTKPGIGCGIHATRPVECATYACMWMMAPNLSDEWKPERARFVLSRDQVSGAMSVVVDPAQASAWRRAPYEAQIRQWAGAAIAAGGQVLLMTGRKVSVILPNSEIEVGVLEAGDSIQLVHDGARFHAQVIKASAA